MMRIMLTGGAGFVAPHLTAALRAALGDFAFLPTAQTTARIAGIGSVEALDVTDATAVDQLVGAFRPTHFIHLAGISALSAAAVDPNLAWEINVLGTLNCARSVLKHAPGASFVFASSSQVYGNRPGPGGLFHETNLLEPTSEYGATKAAADLALGMLAMQGLRSVRLRLFNHTGPGQAETFVVPDFAAQIARIERGAQAPVIKVGNLEAKRDFLDVRDVAEAYVATVRRSDALPSGAVLNICSGRPVSVGALLLQLLALAHVKIAVEIDPARWRENDIPVLGGDNARARALLDWTARRDIAVTLADILQAQRELASAASSVTPGGEP